MGPVPHAFQEAIKTAKRTKSKQLSLRGDKSDRGVNVLFSIPQAVLSLIELEERHAALCWTGSRRKREPAQSWLAECPRAAARTDSSGRRARPGRRVSSRKQRRHARG